MEQEQEKDWEKMYEELLVVERKMNAKLKYEKLYEKLYLQNDDIYNRHFVQEEGNIVLNKELWKHIDKIPELRSLGRYKLISELMRRFGCYRHRRHQGRGLMGLGLKI